VVLPPVVLATAPPAAAAAAGVAKVAVEEPEGNPVLGSGRPSSRTVAAISLAACNQSINRYINQSINQSMKMNS
jgi:hypothetical protein